jgi:ankyrin repeat protein
MNGAGNVMISGLHESNGQRWRNTTISHVQGLVKRDPTVLRREKYGFFPLVRAVSWGANLDIVMWMQEQYKEVVFWEDRDGWNLLHVCARYNYYHLIPFLLYANEKLAKKCNKHGLTPIEVAREDEDERYKCIEYLSDTKDTIETFKIENMLHLDLAPYHMIQALDEYNNSKKWPKTTLERIRYLVDKAGPGCLAKKNEQGSYPLRRAVMYDAKPEVIDYLAEMTEEQGVSAVNVRIMLGMIGHLHESNREQWKMTTLEHIESLVDLSPPTLAEKGGYFNFYPIKYAEQNGGLPEIIDYLTMRTKAELRNGHVKDHDIRLAIDGMVESLHSCSPEKWEATSLDHVKELVVIEVALKGLKKRDAAVLKQKDKYGLIPIHYAVKFGAELDIVEYFAEQYPDGLYFQDQDRFNLLHHAVNEGHNYVLPFLLSSFEEAAELRNKYGKTALDLAIENKNSEAIQILADPHGIIKILEKNIKALRKQIIKLGEDPCA